MKTHCSGENREIRMSGDVKDSYIFSDIADDFALAKLVSARFFVFFYILHFTMKV